MKKLYIISIIILSTFGFTKAQHIGAGLNIGTESLIGFNCKYIHSLDDKFSFNMDAILFLPHVTSSAYVEHVVTRFEVNGNYHYNFRLFGFQVYPYSGLNISQVSTERNLTTTSDDRLNTSEAELEIGINLGTGIIIPLPSNFDIFAEGRYTFHDFDQLLIKGGILFDLN